jgi:putative nucleotidyltransferase with HDIG domain
MAERIRILFVDDEQHVLDGLLRLFRPQRQVWDMLTANSGAQALDLLAHEQVDVVVSDMRMPVMDGAQLLAQVQQLQPKTVRIILSGQSERERALRRVGPCHYYLTKPCDHQRIREVIERACALRVFLGGPPLDAWKPDDDGLPTLPQIYLGMMAELQSQDPSLVRLSALIEQDIAMASSLLHTVNSLAFGLNRTVASISEAVALAGMECLRAMVLGLHVFSTCGRQPGSGLDVVNLWHHSVATARLARAMVQAEHGAMEVAEAAFTAGLLHDSGQMLLAARDPSAYAAVIRTCTAETSLSEVETAVCGVRHEQAGAWLLLDWGLPDDVVEAVAWHHDPSRIPGNTLNALTAVHLADMLLHDVPEAARAVDPGLLNRLGVADRLEGWRELVAKSGG